MDRSENSILLSIYTVTMLMFVTLSITVGGIIYIPILLGLVSCILIAYAHFIIKRFFPKGDKYLLIIAAFLAQFGLVMVYRLDSINSYKKISSMMSIRQVCWFALGMAVFIVLVVFLPEIKKLAALKNFYMILAVLLVASTLFLGTEINGSKNWITFGHIGFQPSELAKLFLILYLSSAIEEIKDSISAIKVSMPVFIMIVFLVFEKDLGGAVIFFSIFMVMIYIGTSNIRYILLGLLALAIGGVISYLLFAYVRVRVEVWINPWKYESGNGYQVIQSLFAIANGGLFGTGIGLGHPNLIPEAYNDFIFAAISEELGLLGAMAVIMLYLILVYRGLRCAIHAGDNYERLVAVGISSMIAFQVFVIVGGVTKMIPLTGITLPFISYGGSSMILNFASLGVLQKISESGRKTG